MCAVSVQKLLIACFPASERGSILGVKVFFLALFFSSGSGDEYVTISQQELNLTVACSVGAFFGGLFNELYGYQAPFMVCNAQSFGSTSHV